jgi:hypothetical protein
MFFLTHVVSSLAYGLEIKSLVVVVVTFRTYLSDYWVSNHCGTLSTQKCSFSRGWGWGGGGINTVISSAKEDSYKEMGEPIPEIDNPEYPLIF